MRRALQRAKRGVHPFSANWGAGGGVTAGKTMKYTVLGTESGGQNRDLTTKHPRFCPPDFKKRSLLENAMAFQAVPDTVSIQIIYTQNAVFVQNSFYAELVGGYVLADLVALAAGIDGQVQGTWKAQQNPNAIYVRTEVRGLALENDITASDNTNAGPGVFVSEAVSNNVTLSVKKTSGLTGRSARGRTYWIGIPRTQLDPVNENLYLGAYVTAVEAAVDSIRTQINALPLWVPVLVSRFTAGLARPTGITFPWTGSTCVDNIVDTQRGRLPTA